MFSYGKQSLDQSDINSVLSVLKSDWLTQGPLVKVFENDLENYFNSKKACVVANGSAALHLTGLALEWRPDDIIITSPLTFLATVNCIVHSGATPDFVDIEKNSYSIDPNLVEKKIKDYVSKGKSVRAIIGVDFAGHPCDWQALREIANKFDIKLVNDNCHAMGASYFGDKHYAVKYADVVTQSYHPVKHITTGEGGAVLTNDSSIDEKIRSLRTHGITNNPSLLLKNDGPWYYEMHELGFNYRITDLQCALGSSQLKKLDNFVKKRRKIAKIYDESLSKIDGCIIPNSGPDIQHSYHLYPLQIEFEKLSIKKIEFFRRMEDSGIKLQTHYIPVHLQPFYKKRFGFKEGDFRLSESFYKNEVSLPIYPDLTKDDVSFVVKNLLEIIST